MTFSKLALVTTAAVLYSGATTLETVFGIPLVNGVVPLASPRSVVETARRRSDRALAQMDSVGDAQVPAPHDVRPLQQTQHEFNGQSSAPDDWLPSEHMRICLNMVGLRHGRLT